MATQQHNVDMRCVNMQTKGTACTHSPRDAHDCVAPRPHRRGVDGITIIVCTTFSQVRSASQRQMMCWIMFTIWRGVLDLQDQIAREVRLLGPSLVETPALFLRNVGTGCWVEAGVGRRRLQHAVSRIVPLSSTRSGHCRKQMRCWPVQMMTRHDSSSSSNDSSRKRQNKRHMLK